LTILIIVDIEICYSQLFVIITIIIILLFQMYFNIIIPFQALLLRNFLPWNFVCDFLLYSSYIHIEVPSVTLPSEW